MNDPNSRTTKSDFATRNSQRDFFLFSYHIGALVPKKVISARHRAISAEALEALSEVSCRHHGLTVAGTLAWDLRYHLTVELIFIMYVHGWLGRQE